MLPLGCAGAPTSPARAQSEPSPVPAAQDAEQLAPVDPSTVELALFPVDDDAALFRGDEGGVSVVTDQQMVPLGLDENEERIHQARVVASVRKHQREETSATRERARRFVATLRPPKARALVIEHWIDSQQLSYQDRVRGKDEPSQGYRLVLVDTRPILERSDFVHAELWRGSSGARPEVPTTEYVAVLELGARGRRRLRRHHDRAAYRRVSLVHRGEAMITAVLLAPVGKLHVFTADPTWLESVFGKLPLQDGEPPGLRDGAE
jgi:hypothetical protein